MVVESPARTRVRKVLSYTFLTVVGLTTLLPFVWMVSASLKPGSVFYLEDAWWKNWIPGRRKTWIVDDDGRELEVRKISETGETVRVRIIEGLDPKAVDPRRHRKFEERDVPKSAYHDAWRMQWRWRNFTDAWNAVNLGRGYVNSLIVALLVTFGQVLTSSLAAFAFARLRFRGRDVLFFGYLATMMIPTAVTMIPIYVMFARGPQVLDQLFGSTAFMAQWYLFGTIEVGRLLGMDSYMALILPGIFSAFGTFMLRQFFMGVPKELEEAAVMDGCSPFGVYWRIFLPISKPALATLTIMVFMGAWKSFTWPLIVGQSQAMQTLPVMLSFFIGEHSQEYNLLMAGSLMVLIPEIVLFIFMQRYFVAGIRLGAIKG